ncbi:tetratricopeptide repeat protein [Actinokineospora iranica]|uniref:Tetratricopeptide repeat-containing protein n=1 Tax=Actinokineospora iranica TaxID=1271860 RepID=A0A1G6R3Z2_9PSEU|nr:tetratricopeptide repeat protein [Actinokineospora iranica]SDC98636.1 Tetratricopeptide repeat-containing protein [Actinokineospora iranica]
MTDVTTLLDRGRLFRASGDPATAARYLRAAADAAPDSRAVLTELALAHFQSAALGPAEEVARRLVELDPSDAYARTLLGRSLTRQSRHAEALPHLRLAAAMTADPDADAALAACRARLS